MWLLNFFLLLLTTFSISVHSVNGPSQGGQPDGTPPGGQIMYPAFYSTKGMASPPRQGTKGMACGLFIQNDDPKPGSGIQLQVAPKSDTDKTLVFSKTKVDRPLGVVGRKYKSGLIEESDLEQALQEAEQEPITQTHSKHPIDTKFNCITWSLSLADDLHVRGLMRNTIITKASNLMNQWTLITLPFVLSFPPALAFLVKRWHTKKVRAELKAIRDKREHPVNAKVLPGTKEYEEPRHSSSHHSSSPKATDGTDGPVSEGKRRVKASFDKVGHGLGLWRLPHSPQSPSDTEHGSNVKTGGRTGGEHLDSASSTAAQKSSSHLSSLFRTESHFKNPSTEMDPTHLSDSLRTESHFKNPSTEMDPNSERHGLFKSTPKHTPPGSSLEGVFDMNNESRFPTSDKSQWTSTSSSSRSDSVPLTTSTGVTDKFSTALSEFQQHHPRPVRRWLPRPRRLAWR